MQYKFVKEEKGSEINSVCYFHIYLLTYLLSQTGCDIVQRLDLPDSGVGLVEKDRTPRNAEEGTKRQRRTWE